MADKKPTNKSAAETPATKQEGGLTDMKARFREALEKKNSTKHASAEGVERDGSEKSHGADGPTGAREFRRKSV